MLTNHCSGFLSAWPIQPRHQISTPFFSRRVPFGGTDLAGTAFFHRRIALLLRSFQHKVVPLPAADRPSLFSSGLAGQVLMRWWRTPISFRSVGKTELAKMILLSARIRVG